MNLSIPLRRIRSYVEQSLIKNGIFILGVNVFPGLVGFFYWKVASLFFTPAEIGLGAAVLSAAALLSNVAGLGIGIGIVRFIPSTERPAALVNSALTLAALTSTLLSLLFAWGTIFWSQDLIILRSRLAYLLSFLFLILFTNLGTILRGVFVAKRQSSRAFTYTASANLLRLPALSIVLGMGSIGILLSNAIAYGLALLYTLLYLVPRVIENYRYQLEIDWRSLKALIPYSFGNFIANVLFQSYTLILPLLVLHKLGPEANGYAYIALMASSLLISPGLSLAFSAYSEGANDSKMATSSFQKAAMISLSITILGAGLLMVFAPWLLTLFGRSYALHATAILRWIALASPLMVLNQIYFNHLRLENRVVLLVALNLLLASITLGGSTLLLPLFGITAIGMMLLSGNLVIGLVSIRYLLISI